MKIAINSTWGGFQLSDKALQYLFKLTENKYSPYGTDIERNDPFLIQVCEELAHEASFCKGQIKIVEIPDDVTNFYIIDYDGQETIHEGRSWSYEETD